MQQSDTPQKTTRTITPYEILMGQIVVNLQAMEFLLRQYLRSQEPISSVGVLIPDAEQWHVGTSLPICSFTDYDTLGRVISKYNRHMATSGGIKIDESLVDLREAMAHGRVFSTKPLSDENHPYLVQFSPPKEDAVKVLFHAPLSPEWLEKQNARILEAINNVVSNLSRVFMKDQIDQK
jgi:hypothetical protein